MKIIFKILVWGISLILFSLTSVVLLNFWVTQSTKNQIIPDVQQLNNQQVGLLLGTTPRLSNGNRNLYFTYRIDIAADLYKKGKVRHLILSGDNSRKEYNEPEEMLNALLKKGVPRNKMTLDYAGFRTLDSVVRSRAVFQQDRILIISQGFHTPRALFIANRFDIEATAFNAKQVYQTHWSKVKMREYIARCLAVIDLYILGREPKFYGDKIDINE